MKYKYNNPSKTSMYMAFVGAFLAPALETIRRYKQMGDLHHFWDWFDDYLAGGILLYAALKIYKGLPGSRLILAAAWGFATGNMLGSFYSQIKFLHEQDPAPVSSESVAIIKGMALLYCIVALSLAMKQKQTEPDNLQ